MFPKLLAEIEKGGTLNPASLAARLEVSPILVEMMLEDLERRGKLTRLSAECASGSCGGCPAAGTCAPKTAARVWIYK